MSDFPRVAIVAAIRLAQIKLIWKSGKAEAHLRKRIRLGHLPGNTTLDDYERLITTLLNSPEARVYIYEFGEIIYPTLVATIEQRAWLVMITMNGVMETSFPPDMPDEYLSNPSFRYMGLAGDIL